MFHYVTKSVMSRSSIELGSLISCPTLCLVLLCGWGLLGLLTNGHQDREVLLILKSIDVARKAVEACSEKQASNIVLLDAREVCSFADFFVICTGDSNRQIRAIIEEVEHSLKETGVIPSHQEGTVDSGWLLLDYGDVIVHVFAKPERDYYQLDELWKEASPVIRIQ